MNGANGAQAAGWLARAARLLDESGDPGVERGYLLVAEARHSIMSGHVEQAADRFAEAAAIGERFGDADLTSLARQGDGRVLIERGEIDRGVALLDEAMVAATAGELSAIIAGIVYCSVLSACADLFDVGRAREWTEALTRWCDAQPDLVPYRGECLAHRAEVISLRGVWPDALREALLACERLGDPRRVSRRSALRSTRSPSFIACAENSTRRKARIAAPLNPADLPILVWRCCASRKVGARMQPPRSAACYTRHGIAVCERGS